MNLPQDKQISVNYKFSLLNLILLIVGVAIIVTLAILLFNKSRELNEQITLNKAVNAELVVWKDKDGLNNAKIEALETQNTKTFLAFETQDEEIKKLQGTVKEMSKYLKKQGSVTNFSTTTDVIATGDTKVIDNSEEPNFPIYESNFEQKDDKGKTWSIGFIRATKDTTTIEQQVFNEYSVVIGLEPKGFLGLGKPVAFGQVKNLNPFSYTETMKTYQVSVPPPKHFGIGLIGGYGIGPDFKSGVFIGIGASYTPIKF